MMRNVVLSVLVAVALSGCGRGGDGAALSPGEKVAALPRVVFATAGDPETVIELPEGLRHEVRIRSAARSIRHEDGRLILSHRVPVHEYAALIFAATGETVKIWNATQPRDGVAYPLRVSSDGRGVVEAGGEAFVGLGDSPWSLFVEPTREEAGMYLRDRAAKGVNLVIGNLIERYFTDNAPPWANAYGDTPFTGETGVGLGSLFGWSVPDLATPRESYWRQVDWVIREAYSHGIAVMAFPAYVGYQHGEQGWTDVMKANGVDRNRAYGRFLGRRYRDYPNIIWSLGGDWGPVFGESDVTAEVNAMAEGIRSEDPVHLMTAKAGRNTSGADVYRQPWLQLNAVYAAGDNTATEMRRNWELRPVLPTFLSEGYYGNEHGTDGADIRRQIWQTFLCGGFAHFYGNSPTWYLGTSEAAPGGQAADVAGLDWRYVLDRFGAQYLKPTRTLINLLDMARLQPDVEGRAIAQENVWAAVGGRHLIAYVAAGVSRATLAADALPRGDYLLEWYSPAVAEKRRGETFRLAGADISFATPDQDDWLMVIGPRGEACDEKSSECGPTSHTH